MKFRKRPIVVDAIRFDPIQEHRINLPDGVSGIPAAGADNWAYAGCRFHVHTIEGAVQVAAGDWIITGVKGEKYPIKDDIFRQTYEPVLD